MAAVAGVFFAYIGFDAVSVLAEESKNPQRDLPRGMIYSLVVCTVIYILLTLVLTGAADYRKFDGVGDPLAFIFESGNLDVPWMQFLVAICAVVAMTSVLLVFQMGQPRIWMSMSRDGLLPPVFAKIHPRFKTPSFATIITGLVVGVPILFTDKTFVLDFTSIATLFAFVLVCGGVLLLPRQSRVAGKFHLPYINGRWWFSLTVIVSIILLVSNNKNYFSDKLSFKTVKTVSSLTPLQLTHGGDSSSAIQSFVQSMRATKNPEIIAKADDIESLKADDAATLRANQVNEIENYVTSFPESSTTAKVSLLIFWLLMVGLAILSVIKQYNLIPLMGVATCLYLLTGMTLMNWIWFGIWLAIGLVIYALYGYRKSKLHGE
jgi:amino acid transporter